jgi:alkylation response protein AidB-like acyl-CoA dehydrogenase
MSIADAIAAHLRERHAGAGGAGLATALPDALRDLIARGLDRLPLPGGGATLTRWQALAAVGAHDLSLLKLYEGHTDALAILAELGHMPASGIDGTMDAWGVWCAEPPDARLALHTATRPTLDGRKAWCSGAAHVDHAIVSCWDEQGRPCLAAVDMRAAGVHVTEEGWHAVGMAACASVDVLFADAFARPVGAPLDYVRRPGFWHGGAGVAAGWYGAACAIGERLRRQLRDVPAPPANDALRLAQLGAIDVALAAAGAQLRAAAAAIDAAPAADTMALALRTRLAVERAATEVIALATRALGAGPLCRDAHFARMVADLPVFLRQSHAERDLAALGAVLTTTPESPWTL